jgi:uncharacterized BrkB/YihY/UPF0761 family membrane protein
MARGSNPTQVKNLLLLLLTLLLLLLLLIIIIIVVVVMIMSPARTMTSTYLVPSWNLSVQTASAPTN